MTDALNTPPAVCVLCQDEPVVGTAPSGCCQGLPCGERCLDTLSEATPAGPDLLELAPGFVEGDPAVCIVGTRAALLEVLEDLDGRIADYGSSCPEDASLTTMGAGRAAAVVWSPHRGITIGDVVAEVKRVALRLHYDLRIAAELRAQSATRAA